jgi:hypothetical protein
VELCACGEEDRNRSEEEGEEEVCIAHALLRRALLVLAAAVLLLLVVATLLGIALLLLILLLRISTLLISTTVVVLQTRARERRTERSWRKRSKWEKYSIEVYLSAQGIKESVPLLPLCIELLWRVKPSRGERERRERRGGGTKLATTQARA